MQENIQKWSDSVFSFAEPGFQEFETSKYLTTILKQNGFAIQEGQKRAHKGSHWGMYVRPGARGMGLAAGWSRRYLI